MPLAPLSETPKGLAASFVDQVLPLIVRRYANISQHLCLSVALLHIFQVGFVFPLLVPSKIFKIAHCFCNPSIEIS